MYTGYNEFLLYIASVNFTVLHCIPRKLKWVCCNVTDASTLQKRFSFPGIETGVINEAFDFVQKLLWWFTRTLIQSCHEKEICKEEDEPKQRLTANGWAIAFHHINEGL